MKNKKNKRWILALFMALLMVITTVMPAFANDSTEPDLGTETVSTEEKTGEAVASKGDGTTKIEQAMAERGNTLEDSRFESFEIEADQEVNAIIVFGMDGANALDEDLTSERAIASRDAMRAQQNAFFASMTRKMDATLTNNYTVLANAIAVNTAFGNLETIEQMEGVEAVYISNTYSVPEITYEDPESAMAAAITGNLSMDNYEENGKGITVAVLDTGILTTHEAFQDYGLTEEVITQEMTEALGGTYLSEKVPFAYDYIGDGTYLNPIPDGDVTDYEGHGTHVAGIAVGYTEDGMEGAVSYIGSAPAAQLVMMKIFSDAGGSTSSNVYFSALEDAFLLGVDVINMSIGSDSGFTYDSDLEDEVFGNIYEKLENAGIILSISAGNDTNMASYNINFAAIYQIYGYELPFADYPDYGVVGSPSTYNGNLSVASMNNYAYPSSVISVDGVNYGYTDTCTDGVNGWYDNYVGQTLEYVLIDTLGGTVAEYEDAGVAGKVAVVQRGTENFQTKVDNAAAAGAIACIVGNNQAGMINMSINPFPIPAIFVSQDAFNALSALQDATTEGLPTLTVEEGLGYVEGDGAMSSFSSWGVTPDLQLKPSITGIGGNVYSASIAGDDEYELMSGTSMAAPNVTGSFATLLSYLKTAYPGLSKVEYAEMAEGLALSTADIQTDSYGYPLPTRQQGAGLIDIEAATEALAYFSEPIQNLYDSTTGTFTFEYEVVNPTNVDTVYEVDVEAYMPYYASLTNPLFDNETYFDALELDYLYCDITVEIDGKETTYLYVPRNGTETIKITIQTDPDFIAYLEYMEIANNGFYVEGFVKLSPLAAGVEYYEVEFENSNEVILVENGDTLEDYVLPEIPKLYGTRGGEWDVDVTEVVPGDMFVSAKYDYILYGDATCGGEVDAADAAGVLRHIVKIEELTPEGIENASVTAPYDQLKAADAAAILRYVTLLIDRFPIEERNDEMNALGLYADRSEYSMYKEEELEDLPVIHGTFLGFCGDWTEASVLEPMTSFDYLDLLAIGYQGYYPYFYDIMTGYSKAYLTDSTTGDSFWFGGNLWEDEGYNSVYNAFTIADETDADFFWGDGLYVNPHQLRNARHLIMTVYDAETGEVYYQDDTEWLPKARPVLNSAGTSYVYQSYGNFAWDGYDYNGGMTDRGDPVPSGTEVIVAFTAQLHYDDAPMSMEWWFPVTVDYTAPTIEMSYDRETNEVTVHVSDNDGIAYIDIYDQDWNSVLNEYTVDGIAAVSNPDGSITYTFTPDETVENITVDVQDYATNVISGYLEVGTTPLEDVIADFENEVYGEYTTRGVVHTIDSDGGFLIQTTNAAVSAGQALVGLAVALDSTVTTEVKVGDIVKLTGETELMLPYPYMVATEVEVTDTMASEDIYSTQLPEDAELVAPILTRVSTGEPFDTTGLAQVTLVAHDVWGDGSGYQLLLDKDAVIYAGVESDEDMTYAALYGETDYSIPVGADYSLEDDKMVIDGEVSIYVPAGTYDYILTNPTPGDRIYIVGDNGPDLPTATGFVLEEGKNYIFTMAKYSGGDGVEITEGELVAPAFSSLTLTKVDAHPQGGYICSGTYAGTQNMSIFIQDVTYLDTNGDPQTRAPWVGDVVYGLFATFNDAPDIGSGIMHFYANPGEIYLLTAGTEPTPEPSEDPVEPSPSEDPVYPAPSEDPTPTPNPTRAPGITPGTYYISVTHNGTTYYMNTLGNNRFTVTSNIANADTWTFAVSGDGYTIKSVLTNLYVSATADSTSITLSETAQVWTWDDTNNWLRSTVSLDRALGYQHADGGGVFRHYAHSNASQSNYSFAITLTPVT
ncbi:MAG: S8 family serine peptidase [Clostridia bacterium]|nr:S8 family serine peptidase [Clostridia bacterium]